ncbi:hypothetical protein LEN26_016599 [Aphanomyces euteiches]|nr:hypothetical protein LEN26_016599 [Aphanomyces euteiches]KAH9121186.1 hypothetical protein AeMF1_006987 [Aphanomyces euteiches]KAH9166746.1 hypothetical protein AeNC1_018278 [Aphanomyces euteiches]
MPILKRLAPVRLSSFGDMECYVQGTSLRKSGQFRFGRSEVVFQVKVALVYRRAWTFQCTLSDVEHLRRQLLANVHDDEFCSQLETLACPKRPMFRRRDTQVIKGMCCELDHYLGNFLRLCQNYNSTASREEAAIVETAIRDFMRPSKSMSKKNIFNN